MTIKKFFTLCLALPLSLLGTQQSIAADTQNNTHYDAVMAYWVVSQLQDFGVIDDIQATPFSQALKAALEGKPNPLTDEDYETQLTALRDRAFARQHAQTDSEKRKNQQEEATFLATNRLNPNTLESPTGLQYQVIKQGKGQTLTGNDWRADIHYHGYFINGETFDQTQREHPSSVSKLRLLPGLAEGLEYISEGGKIRLVLPADLAFGDSPAGPGGAGKTLIYEVELIKSYPEPSAEERIAEINSQLQTQIDSLQAEAAKAIAYYQQRQ